LPKLQRGLLVSFVLVIIFYLLVSALCAYLGIGVVSYALFALIPALTVWVSMGVSVRCLPMLPACLLTELLTDARNAVPFNTSVPAVLVTGNGTALRPCGELGFVGWADTADFWVCDLGMCGENGTLRLYTSRDWAETVRRADADTLVAYRWCGVLTAVNVMPLLLLLQLAWALLTGAFYFGWGLAVQLGLLIWSVIIFNHEDRKK
jgi:hypothetical protein